jgi:hypothetical protein
MSAGSRAKTVITVLDEGVVATQSAAGFSVCLPRPESARHQLRIVAVLWEVWKATRIEVCRTQAAITLDISALVELPLPLIAVVSAIDGDLGQSGRKLVVVAGHYSDSSAICGI